MEDRHSEIQSQSIHPIALSIAGFDPSAGAGVLADLKVFAAHRIYGMACITALTVQSTTGVSRVEPTDPRTIAETLGALREDVTLSGIKIGMLGTASAVVAIVAFLREGGTPRERIVLDPVLRSSSGAELLQSAGVLALLLDLLGAVGWITPNAAELALLTGVPVKAPGDVPAAAACLQAGSPGLGVLVTGGDGDPPDDYLLLPDGASHWLRGTRVETTSTHGTGCALSSALLCRLMLGDSPLEAAAGAKAYVAEALAAAYPIGRGRGPMNHLFRMDSS